MKKNERGFMLLSTIFLTVIVSFVAAMTLQTLSHSQNADAALRLHAINLANEQFAMIESLAAQNKLNSSSYDFLGNEDDLKSYGLFKESNNQTPIEFEVKATVSNVSDEENLRRVEVVVTWKNFEIDFDKIVRVGNGEE